VGTRVIFLVPFSSVYKASRRGADREPRSRKEEKGSLSRSTGYPLETIIGAEEQEKRTSKRPGVGKK